MLNLIAKDFKLMYANKEDKKQKVLSYLLSALFLVIFVTLETFIFSMVLNKIKNIYLAPISYMSLFLFVITILMIVLDIVQAKKLIFNPLDLEQLNVHPIPNEEIIVSKLIFLFLNHYLIELIFTYPLFVAYGVLIGKMPSFYFLALFYPLLTFFFDIGISLILVYPYKLIYDWLKKHTLVEFLVIIVGIFVATYFYSKVLSVFINLVASNQLSTLFSTAFINKLSAWSKYFVPVRFLVELFINRYIRGFYPYILFTLGLFTLGVLIASVTFKTYKQSRTNKKLSKKPLKVKLVSPIKALIKKELVIILKNSSMMFSFTGLLVVQPFLSYLVINALNTIFRSGTFSFYLTMLPNFIVLIDILVIMLFSLIIAQGANNYISSEGSNVKFIKTLPISPFIQIVVKVALPYVLSAISLIVSLLILRITKEISTSGFFAALIYTLLMLFVFNLVSLFEELKIKRNKPRTNYISNLYSYLIPLSIFIIGVLLSYFRVSIYLVYLIGLGIIIVSSLPYLVNIKKKVEGLFLALEVEN